MKRKENKFFDAEARSLSRKWTRMGRELYRAHGEEAEKFVDTMASSLERECIAEVRSYEEKMISTERSISEVEKEISQYLTEHRMSIEEISGRIRRARFRRALAILMTIVGMCLLAWSFGYFFYGKGLLLAVVSFGAGLAIFMCVDVFLRFLEKVLNQRQFTIFNAIIATAMVAFFFAGFVLLSEARAVQMEIQRANALEFELDDQKIEDIEQLKSRLDTLGRRSMLFLFIGFEWLTGVFFFLASRELEKYAHVLNLEKKRRKNMSTKKMLASRKALLEKVNSSLIRSHLYNGVTKERRKGSLPLMIAALIIIFGVLFLSLFLAEQSFGGVFRAGDKRCRYIFVAFDTTGSTQYDREENERLVVKIIRSLRACDEFQLMNITNATFSDPEYVLSYRMPPRTGYFNEEIRKHQLRLVRQFRKMCRSIPKTRPSTSLVEGLYLFSQLLQERSDLDKKLIIISDMLEFSGSFTPHKIASKGGSILEELKVQGLIPDMKGIDVYVLGASTAGLNPIVWAKVRCFWSRFFKEAGANLKCYMVQRVWPQD